jgi:hypothetical protein
MELLWEVVKTSGDGALLKEWVTGVIALKVMPGLWSFSPCFRSVYGEQPPLHLDLQPDVLLKYTGPGNHGLNSLEP